MTSGQASEPLDPIDNDLFHSYTRYQLCQLKKSTSLWVCNKEKEAMLNILGQFESIDGNTLRMVVNEIFEKSSVPHNSTNDTNEASTSTHRLVEDAPSSPSTVSADAHNNEAADRTRATSTITSKKRSEGPPLTQERPLAKKSKTDDPVVEKLKNLLSRPNVEELLDIANHVERSEYVILTRMRRVNGSFKLKMSTATSHYSLHISTSFGDFRGPMSMCQSNLIAYQFGKLLLKRGESRYKDKRQKAAESKCYHAIKEEMLAHGQRIATPVCKYIHYAQTVVQAADKIGVYALFMPEVVSPYGFQIISRFNFSVLKSCLDAKCAGLKRIARFDHEDNLIMAEMDYSRKHGDKSYLQTTSKFLNSST